VYSQLIWRYWEEISGSQSTSFHRGLSP
jgi:hypothetical protein